MFKRLLAALSLCLFAGLAAAQSVPSKTQTLTGPGTVTLLLNQAQLSAVSVQFSGSGSGIASTFQVTSDGTNWTTVPAYATGNCAPSASQSANGNWVIPVSSFVSVRANVTALTGSETVTINGNPGAYNGCAPQGLGGVPVPSIPPKLTAQGSLTVSSSSVALSTLLVATNSAAWSTTLPNSYITVRNDVSSTATLYFCPFGGTCATSGANKGVEVAIGEAIPYNLASPANPTLVCGSVNACNVQAEE